MKIFNTLTREKDEFKPIKEGEVKIYACGPTVYNYIHIGNARPLCVFDVLRRYLEWQGYKVTFVQNFTDIDDKLIKKANEEGLTVPEIAERYIKEFWTDAKGLNVREATVHPRATENIKEIQDIISALMEKGYAYESGGDVYYRAKKFEDYGKLSHQPLEDLEAGARIGVAEIKEDPMDFCLWKGAKPGEPYWESPWGNGRPGWHIECSAMACRYLGKTIDIHCGGLDLIFPHHENEIAQSECCNGVPFAKYWMHNGFLNIDNRKMSKSLGNFFTVREISEKYDLQVLRFFMLSAHYRSPLNFSADLMAAAKNGLDRILTAAERLHDLADAAEGSMTDAEKENFAASKEYVEKFEAAMEDDANTADAVSAVFELVKFINVNSSEQNSKEYLQALYQRLETLCDVLGIIIEKKEEILDSDIEALIAERQAARKEKNFARADEIRDMLLEQGIILEDTREGVKWKRA